MWYTDMSSKMQFQVFYGEYNVMYGQKGLLFNTRVLQYDNPFPFLLRLFSFFLEDDSRYSPTEIIDNCSKIFKTKTSTDQ